MRSRYSQITVFVLNAISDVFTSVTYILLSFALKAARKALFLCVINYYDVDQRKQSAISTFVPVLSCMA